MPQGILYGEKVILREFRKEDALEAHKWVNNENINKFLSFAIFPQTFEGTQAFIDRNLIYATYPPTNGGFVIALKDDPAQTYIGSCGFHGIDYRQRYGEIGITIGREDLLSKGLGEDAIKLLLDFGFNTLNLHKINLSYYAYNVRGARCYEKCGFKHEGRIRDRRFYNGQYYDIVMMGIT